MKKRSLFLMAGALALGALSSCGGGTVSDEKTINVKLLLGGYGSDWLYQTIRNFEQVYAEEGYKINLLNPNTQVTGNNVRADLLEGYNKKNIDLYFTGSLDPASIGGGQDGVLALALDELVFNQKAIAFDGTEEEKTVREKLDPSFTDVWYKYDNQSYNFFYQRAIGGLVVNFDKLTKCGFNYLPVTTDQFLNMIHTIRMEQKRVRPFTYVKNTGYASAGLLDWFTQLGGVEKWYTFQSMNNPDGSYNLETGMNVFTDTDWVDAGEKVFNMFDYNNFLRGSKNYGIQEAHASLMTPFEDGGAVFLFDGDWALNETRADFPDETELSQLRFINVPVNSSVGTKLWGPGTEFNSNDAELVDRILAKVVTLADENMEVSEIKEQVLTDLAVSISEESILAACQARGIYYNRGLDTGTACVPVGIREEHKDIVAKLLRMIASDDFSRLYFSTSKCFSPYSKAIHSTETLLPFSEGHKKIATNKYATGILQKNTGLRREIGGELNRLFPGQTSYYHDVAIASDVTAYDEESGDFDPSKTNLYTSQAQAELDKAFEYVNSNWSKFIEPFKN